MNVRRTRQPVLPIGSLPRVDLLPPSEMRRRDMLARARAWMVVGIAAVAVSALLVGGAAAYHVASSVRLGLEQARTQQILTGIAELSEVSEALATRGDLQALRADAMAGDLEWTPAVALIASHLPAGVTITGFSLDAGAAPVAGSDPTSATGTSGTVTVQTPAAIDLVAATRDLREAPAVIAADLESLTAADGVFTYTLRIALDQSVYTGAFTAEE